MFGFARPFAPAILLGLLAAPLRAQKAPPVVPRLGGTTPSEALRAAPKAISQIQEEHLLEHVRFLSSEPLGGRLTATVGQAKTAEYVAETFRKLGLKPWGAPGRNGRRSFFQGYPVVVESLDEKSGLQAETGEPIHAHGAWFPSRAASVELEGPLIFCDRGRKSDYEGLDLEGHIPVVVAQSPGAGRMTVMRAMGLGFRFIGRLRGISMRAKQAGAPAAVVVLPSLGPPLLSVSNFLGIFPGKPKITKAGPRGGGMHPMLAFPVPLLILGGGDADKVLSYFGLDFDKLSKAREKGESFVGETSKQSFRLVYHSAREKLKALNVCALLEGRDPELKQEAVLYSCHMDHLGRAADGSYFPGADDNASGTASVLEIARAYAALPEKERPRRSILFLVVSGEELGLWGSSWFVKHPTWPLEKIVADVNMDMVGRSTKKVPSDTIAVTPTYRNRAFSSLAREAAWLGLAFGLQMANGDRFYARSDHYNFAKAGIPVVFFCDDEHPDYHMPTDTADKIEFDKVERVARLSFLLGYRTANRDGRPETLGRQADWFAGLH